MPHGKSAPRVVSDAPNRRVLGEVTPNAKVHAPIAEQLAKRSFAGSPLKRSFTAALEEDKGLTYLKRRRTSEDRNAVHTGGSDELATMNKENAATKDHRSLEPEVEVEQEATVSDRSR